jgi:hypothetical protein
MLYLILELDIMEVPFHLHESFPELSIQMKDTMTMLQLFCLSLGDSLWITT